MKILQSTGWLLALLVVTLAQNQDKPFQGHKVLRIKPSSKKDVETLSNLETDYKLDFWHLPHSDDGHVDIRVSPEFLQKLLNKVKEMNLEFQELVSDVQTLVDEENRGNRFRRATNTLESYTRMYLSYDQINTFLNIISARSSSSSLLHLGTSAEGRSTKAIKIGYSSPYSTNKPAIFIDAGFHAREWIAPATAINFIYQLALNPNNDTQITDLLRKFDFYIAPIVNPDGYEYSRTNYRLWRKNRRHINGNCFGVDINRNFDYHWNPSLGGSTNPCSDLYSGTSGFSEPESQNIGSFLRSKKPNIKGYLTLHSYGQYWLYPWGYSTKVSPVDEASLSSVASDATSAMQNRYTVGGSAKVLYVAAGGSDDYAKGVAGVPYSYTVELPPLGNSGRGFILPAEDIPLVARDTFKGLKAFSYSVYRRLGSPTPVRPTTTTTTTQSPFQYWNNNNFYQYWWNHYFGK